MPHALSGLRGFFGRIFLPLVFITPVMVLSGYSVYAVTVASSTLKIYTSGLGTVVSVGSSPAIYCGRTCSGKYTRGASVTLSATPAPGYVFSTWRYGCSGQTSTCSVAMDGSLKYVQAVFKESGTLPVASTATTSTATTTSKTTTSPTTNTLTSSAVGIVAATTAGSLPAGAYTLFTTQMPASLAVSDGVNYELGTRFVSTKSGKILAVRFYKANGETGAHKGNIWNGSGKLIGSVTFSGETTSGWQTQYLITPITIGANQVYTVSVNTGKKLYVADNEGLSSAIINGSLSTVVGGNGRYGSPGKYPTKTWMASNYFRDIIFIPDDGTAPPPPPTDTTPPSQPTALTATAISSSQINLSWVTSTDNVGVTGYRIYRNGTQIGTSTTNSYQSTGLSASTSYSYTVAAYDTAGNVSNQSNTASAMTQTTSGGGGGGTPTPTNGTCGSSNGGTFTTTPTTNLCSAGTASSVTTNTTMYTWSCAGSNGGTIASCSATRSVTDTAAPSVPTGLTATAISSSQINLSWVTSTDNVGVTGYRIYRNGTQIGTSTTNSYQSTGLSASTSYSYTVAAYDTAGNVSNQSNTASAMTQASQVPNGTSALATLAASMTPGTWAQLITSDQNAVLGVGSVSSTTLHYANSMPWNPVNHTVEIIGMDHNYPGLRHMRYDESMNRYILVSDNFGVGPAHGYDHNAVNPYTGDLYHRLYSGFTGKISSKKFANGVMTSLPDLPAADQVAIGATWWSGNFVGGGSQGSFMIFNSGNGTGGPNDGQIGAYNPLTNSWFYDESGKAPGYGGGYNYSSLIEYSSVKNVAVYGGGNVAPRKLWKISANGSVVSMPDVPSGKTVGTSQDQGEFVDDPVTGNFLLLSAGELWELNPDGNGSWRQLANPPSGVGNPNAGTNGTAIVASSISDYGVVMYITQPSANGGTTFLYKPSATTSPNPTPTNGSCGSSNGGTFTTTPTANLCSTGVASSVTTNTNNYTWGCAGSSGGTTAQCSATRTTITPAPTLSFTTSSTSITSGGSATLSWSSPNSTSCTAGGGWTGTKGISGTQTVSPAVSITYSLICSGAGGSSPTQSVTVNVTTTPPTGTSDFATRCSQPGVVKCVGFDATSDFNIGNGGTSGAYGQNSGILPPWSTSDYTRATQDTLTKAGGNSSLKFTIPPNSGSDTSGSWFTNFSSDLGTQFGESSEFFVQWRQRFSPEFLNTKYLGGGGWKQMIIGTGDQPSKVHASCTTLELPMQNTYHRGFPVMYNSCAGSTSHGPYDGFEEPFGTYDFKLQNARPAPYCLYSQSSSGYFSPNGNCFGYFPNEWMTFQVQIKTGPRVGDEFVNSYINVWMAREGQPSEQIFAWGPYNLSAGSLTDNQRYGKIWFLPYNTGKSASETHPTAYTWYDELIISRNRIADPR